MVPSTDKKACLEDLAKKTVPHDDVTDPTDPLCFGINTFQG
jgi:hypothetical protein